MRRLSVCILGGSGFIGQALCARLVRLGHGVRVVSRRPLLPPGLAVLPGVELWAGNAYNRSFLRSAVAGQDVVINLVGILNEAGRDGRGFERAHVDLTRAVVAACREAHVPRLLHMSALHASDQGPSHYLRTKAAMTIDVPFIAKGNVREERIVEKAIAVHIGAKLRHGGVG